MCTPRPRSVARTEGQSRGFPAILATLGPCVGAESRRYVDRPRGIFLLMKGRGRRGPRVRRSNQAANEMGRDQVVAAIEDFFMSSARRGPTARTDALVLSRNYTDGLFTVTNRHRPSELDDTCAGAGLRRCGHRVAADHNPTGDSRSRSSERCALTACATREVGICSCAGRVRRESFPMTRR